MSGGVAGMTMDEAGTSGGRSGTNGAMNGAQRRIAAAFATGFAAILLVIMAANAESMIADFQAAHVPETAAHVWIWEATSIVAWLVTTPPIWWAVAAARRRMPRWWVVLIALALGSVVASAIHIVLMWWLRVAVYAAMGEHYVFMDGLQSPIAYEYRKDIATFLQFVALALVAQWAIARAGDPAVVEVPAATPAERILMVGDGATTHRVPVDEIGWVQSAANYVEIGWRGRTLLHRATLAGVADELGDAFVRIHRGRLVRRAAVRRVETDRSGDFLVTLDDGTTLRGSRRYRLDAEAAL